MQKSIVIALLDNMDTKKLFCLLFDTEVQGNVQVLHTKSLQHFYTGMMVCKNIKEKI